MICELCGAICARSPDEVQRGRSRGRRMSRSSSVEPDGARMTSTTGRASWAFSGVLLSECSCSSFSMTRMGSVAERRRGAVFQSWFTWRFKASKRSRSTLRRRALITRTTSSMNGSGTRWTTSASSRSSSASSSCSSGPERCVSWRVDRRRSHSEREAAIMSDGCELGVAASRFPATRKLSTGTRAVLSDPTTQPARSVLAAASAPPINRVWAPARCRWLPTVLLWCRYAPLGQDDGHWTFSNGRCGEPTTAHRARSSSNHRAPPRGYAASSRR